MKNLVKTVSMAVIVFGLFLILGCTNSNKIISGPENDFVLSVQPANGAANVPVTTSVQIAFASPMDTSSVALNFCLIGGEKMYEVMDSLNHSMMDYSDMMDWMHSKSFPGHFQWNSKRDTCVFSPDSSLAYHMEYMIYMGRNMQSRHQDMMMEHKEMMGKDFITHFSTENR